MPVFPFLGVGDFFNKYNQEEPHPITYMSDNEEESK